MDFVMSWRQWQNYLSNGKQHNVYGVYTQQVRCESVLKQAFIQILHYLKKKLKTGIDVCVCVSFCGDVIYLIDFIYCQFSGHPNQIVVTAHSK